MPYYEDFEVGQKATGFGRTITDGMATVLINVGGFVAPFFNDETVANLTPLGWRALPGRLIFALMGGLVEQMPFLNRPPGIGILVGANNIKWKIPVKVGDTVHLEMEVVELSETKNRKWGRIIDKETLINQKGEVVCEADIVHLFEHKPT